MRVFRPPVRSRLGRRGVTTLLVVAALVAALLAGALILDYLWLSSAAVELTTAAEASALAAAQALASEDRLRPQADPQELVQRALSAAVLVAAQNRVAGEPVALDPASDIRLGRYVTTSEQSQQFLETDHAPTHVQVLAQRTRERGHPLGLFLSRWTGVPSGDVAVQVEAGCDHRVVGLRPFAGAPVPALPLAIWREDPTGQRQDTWRAAIEERRGRDEFAFDPDTRQVLQQPDGLTELTLRSRPRSGTNERVNLLVVDVGSEFDDERLTRQFATGWLPDDLAPWGGTLRLGPATAENSTPEYTLPASPDLRSTDRELLERQLGVPRIAWLYSTWQPGRRSALGRANCVSWVALRVMAVRDLPDGSAELVVQPAVLTTRTALTDPAAPEHAYLCRLTLTR